MPRANPGNTQLLDGQFKARIYRPNAANRSIWKQEVSRSGAYVLVTDPETGRHQEEFVDMGDSSAVMGAFGRAFRGHLGMGCQDGGLHLVIPMLDQVTIAGPPHEKWGLSAQDIEAIQSDHQLVFRTRDGRFEQLCPGGINGPSWGPAAVATAD